MSARTILETLRVENYLQTVSQSGVTSNARARFTCAENTREDTDSSELAGESRAGDSATTRHQIVSLANNPREKRRGGKGRYARKNAKRRIIAGSANAAHTEAKVGNASTVVSESPSRPDPRETRTTTQNPRRRGDDNSANTRGNATKERIIKPNRSNEPIAAEKTVASTVIPRYDNTKPTHLSDVKNVNARVDAMSSARITNAPRSFSAKYKRRRRRRRDDQRPNTAPYRGERSEVTIKPREYQIYRVPQRREQSCHACAPQAKEMRPNWRERARDCADNSTRYQRAQPDVYTPAVEFQHRRRTMRQRGTGSIAPYAI